MDLVEGERHAAVRDLVFLRYGGRGGVQVRAESAEKSDDDLRSKRLQPGDGLGRVGFIVEKAQLERQLLAGDAHASGRVDGLDGQLVACANLGSASSVASGQRDDGADLDRLRRVRLARR